ncbi:MAG: Flp pilus assembly protein CpaB [Gammaproteobacteria bacterium]|nr:Flp pilus assembly protein CpaB [Gammaproteobacteria bacterium]
MIIRILLLMTIAVGGLGVYYLTQIYFNRVEAQAQQQFLTENNLQGVLIFAKDLPRGTRLSAADFMWEERLKETIPATAYKRDSNPNIIETLSDSFSARAVSAGELVSPDVILSSGAGFMALAIRPGLRAIAVRTSAVQIAGGFVQPEDRLDVIHTVMRDLDGDGITNGLSETILENVRVLAVGDVPTERFVAKTSEQQDKNKTLTGDKVIQAETITLELSEAQARILISAGSSGSVTFALRPVENPSAMPKTGSLKTLDLTQYATTEAEVPSLASPMPQTAGPTTISTVIIDTVETTTSAPPRNQVTIVSPTGVRNVAVPSATGAR